MKRVYYQRQIFRALAGVMLMLFGVSPLILFIYLGIKDHFSAWRIFVNFFSAFTTGDIFLTIAWLFLTAFFLYVTLIGFLFIKNARGVISLEFCDKEIRFVVLNIKSKGDILATGFGYFQDYDTIKYKDIQKVELVKSGNKKLIKVVTKRLIKILTIRVSNEEAEAIKKFVTSRMN